MLITAQKESVAVLRVSKKLIKALENQEASSRTFHCSATLVSEVTSDGRQRTLELVAVVSSCLWCRKQWTADGVEKVKVNIDFGEGDSSASESSTDVASEFARVTHKARSRLRDAAMKMADKASLSTTSVVHATPHLTGNGPTEIGCGCVRLTLADLSWLWAQL